MRFLAVLCLPLALAACTCGGGGVASRYGDLVVVQAGATGREVLLREATVALPPAFMSTTARGEVPVRNVGQEDVVIASVERVEGDEALSLEDAAGLTVTPQADAALPVRFTPPQAAEATALEVQHRAKFLLRLSGAREGEDVLTVELVAQAVARDCFVPAVVDFGAVPLQQAVVTRVPLENGRPLPATLTFGAPQGPDAAAFFVDATSPLDVAAAARVELPVRFAPLEERGYEARLAVQRAADCPMAELRLVGRGSNDALAWAPAQLDFGRVPLGVSVTKTVTVTNRSNVPLPLAPSVSGADFGVEPGAPTVVPALGTATVQVSCLPLALGPLGGQLTLELGTVPPTPARVPLTCVGGGPRIRVDPSPIQFGQVPATATGALATRRRFLVQNVGTPPPAPGDAAHNLVLGRNGALPWFAVVPRNGRTRTSEFSVTRLGTYDNAVGLPAVAGSNIAEFEVLIAPTSTGLREADLVVYSNDPKDPELRVPITAVPRAPEPCSVEASPEGVDFGATPRGAVVSRVVTVRNVSANAATCLVSGIELAPGSSLAFQVVDPAVSSLVLDPGEAKSIRVQAAVPGDASVGDYLRGTLRFRVGVEQSLRALPVDLRVSRCLVVDPPLLDLGLVQQGCVSGSKPITLYNVCGLPITVTGVSGPALPFRLTTTPFGNGPVTIDPGSLARLAVAVAPQATGPLSDVVRIESVEAGAMHTEGVALRAQADPFGVQSDVFTQGDAQVDILFVIDDSCSMGDEQQELASNFAAFLSSASQSSGDWRIGVTTTDVFGVRGLLAREPGAVPWLTPATPNVAGLFAQRVRVGVNGSGFEQPLAAMQLAVTEPNLSGANRGFLRGNAALAVVIVTDAVEQSPNSVGSYLAAVRAAKGNRNELVSVSVVGPFTPPGAGCSTEGAVDSGRYATAIQATNGVTSDICTQNWASDLQAISRSVFGARKAFELSGTARSTADVTVRINGSVVTGGWAYSAALNAVVFSSPPPPGAQLEITYRTACF